MVAKFNSCGKWCASPKDEHIHDGSDCDGNTGSIFHARTNQEDSTIPVGKCVLLTKSTKDTSKCKYAKVPKDKLELGDDTSKKVDFNEAKDYVLEGDNIADGIITIKAVKIGKYLEKDGNHLKAPKDSPTQCDEDSRIAIEPVTSNDYCDNEGTIYSNLSIKNLQQIFMIFY